MVSDEFNYGVAFRTLAGIIILALLLAGGASAATLTVNANGSADYIKIQDAVNAASAGDTILVYSGTYYETVTVNKQLELKGHDSGSGMPMINTVGLGDAITVTANGVTIDGFNAKTGGLVYNIGIKVTSNNNLIKNNIVSNNNYGIYLNYSSNNNLSGNTANSNTIDGIYLNSSNNNTIIDNNASNNNYGIYLNYSSNNNLRRNTANSNNSDGIYLNSSNNNNLNGNTANSNNNYGIYLNSFNNNTLIDNNASNNNYGIYLNYSSNNNLSGNTANFNHIDGIYLNSSNNNYLSENTANLNTNYGIYLNFFNNNTLIDNNASNNNYGIYFNYSRNNLFLNNTMTGNVYNFGLFGTSDLDFDNQIDKSNTVDGKLIYFVKNDKNTIYDYSNNVGTFYCIGCFNVTIKDTKLSKNEIGILFWNTTLSRIQNINASNNVKGIWLNESSNNMLNGNDASNNIDGIYLNYSNNNNLSKNTVNSNTRGGIYIFSSINDILNNNTITNIHITAPGESVSGIYIHGSTNNTLMDNTISDLRGGDGREVYGNGVPGGDSSGIYLSDSNNNTLIDNAINNLTGGTGGRGIAWKATGGPGGDSLGINMSDSNNNTLIYNVISNVAGGAGGAGLPYGGVVGESNGIYLYGSNKNIFSGNTICGTGYSMFITESSSNSVLNNYFNNTNNAYSASAPNIWNIAKTLATNIVGGPYLGGNFWANPSGTGFSQTCIDADSDGICDSPFVLNATNIDYLPLANKPYIKDTILPSIAIVSPTNGQTFTTSTMTISGTASDNVGLSNVEVKVGFGSWKFASGTNTWNVTATLASGSNMIYARATDTSGNTNETSVTVSYYNPLPIAEYHFDGNASDSSGNNNHGIINGATFVQGISGQALSFDGVDDYVRVNNISVGQSITVLAWAKSATPTWNQYGWIASARVANGFIIHPNIGKKYWDGFIANSDGNNSQIGIYTPGDITQWHQYGIIYDYDAKKEYMVFDGQIVANKSISMTRIAGNINIEFGKDYGFEDRYGNGTIDEISIYNIALNTSEIMANYNALIDNSTEEPFLVFAITPNSRIAQIGVPITLYLSIINGGTATANDVSIKQASILPATVSYQPWDGLLFTGAKDTPVNIIAGETVHFMITIDATAAFDSSPMTFNVSGTNVASASMGIVNTLTISGITTPYADVIMKSTSLNVSTPVNTSIAFAVATTNVGAANAANVSLVLSFPPSITGVAYQVNQTNPITGAIIGPATGLTINVGAQPTFAVFLTPTQPIAYDPANNRITLQLVDGSGKIIGAQSVAVSTT